MSDRWQIIQGDCLGVLATLPADSADAIVTDPPYGLKFMGKGWDHGVPGIPYWQAALRVAKPGAHLIAFGGTRTHHRLMCAIEDAGWEIRDTLGWLYGSGFPKSLDVGKAIDKRAGAKRKLGPKRVSADGTVAHDGSGKRNDGWERPWRDDITAVDRNTRISYPATPAAEEWDGWGTALKPAWEPIILARKPLAGTVAENVLRYRTGCLNVDGCRVGSEMVRTMPGDKFPGVFGDFKTCPGSVHQGRFPANVLHDGSQEVLALFPPARSSCGGGLSAPDSRPGMFGIGGNGHDSRAGQYYDSGSAARFFYCAKASKSDRDEGLASGIRHPASGPRANHHPTVKPTSLMRYLCRLVTPPGGLVLDPFTGSGSTGKAALLEGFRFHGIEREAEYCEIARARLAAAASASSR